MAALGRRWAGGGAGACGAVAARALVAGVPAAAGRGGFPGPGGGRGGRQVRGGRPGPRGRGAARAQPGAGGAGGARGARLPPASDCRFAWFANWLRAPGCAGAEGGGSVMVGRYPFVEPSSKGPFADAGPRAPEVGRENLRALLGADIDTFVCLQDELPPQGEMPAGGIGGFLRYDEEVAALAKEAGGDPSGLEFVKFSIVDMSVPTQDYLAEIVADLEERVRQGRNLYIHCWGGRGRAGTVGAALMAALYEADGSEILELVQAGYSSRGFDDYKSPETMDQLRTVHRFVQRLDGDGA